jgi:hypothetical protein
MYLVPALRLKNSYKIHTYTLVEWDNSLLYLQGRAEHVHTTA